MNLKSRWKALLKNLLVVALLLPALAAQAGPLVEVFKSPDCGCCGDWVKHLQTNGFEVRVRDVAEPGEHRRRLGMPDDLGACHTATVGGNGRSAPGSLQGSAGRPRRTASCLSILLTY